MHPLEIVVSGVGLAVGGLAGWLWSFISDRLGDDDFWQRLRTVVGLLVSAEGEDRFFQEYVKLLPLLMKFLAKKLITLALAFAPVVIAFLSLTLLATPVWNKRLTHVEVSPPQVLSVDVAGETLHLDESHNAIPSSVDLNAPAVLHTKAGEFHCESLMEKQAYSPHLLQWLTLIMLDWDMLAPQTSEPADAAPSILLRPSSGDDNVFWPYLNDWEFDFFVAVSLGSIIGILVPKVRKR